MALLLWNVVEDDFAKFSEALTNLLAMQIVVSSTTCGLDRILIQDHSHVLDKQFHGGVMARHSRTKARFQSALHHAKLVFKALDRCFGLAIGL